GYHLKVRMHTCRNYMSEKSGPCHDTEAHPCPLPSSAWPQSLTRPYDAGQDPGDAGACDGRLAWGSRRCGTVMEGLPLWLAYDGNPTIVGSVGRRSVRP